MAERTDRAPQPLVHRIKVQEENTSVNSGMAKGTDRAPLPLVHRINWQDKNTSVNTRTAISTDRAPILGQMGKNTSVN